MMPACTVTHLATDACTKFEDDMTARYQVIPYFTVTVLCLEM